MDDINKPDHYNQSPLQPIDVIYAWNLDYCLGNVIKYICRHQHKEDPYKDLKKAQWYLSRAIEKYENGSIDRKPLTKHDHGE